MSDIISTCRAAWNSTKREHQPEYDDLVESYRTMLTARAEGVLAADTISEDAPFHPFENGVLSQPKSVEESPPAPIHLESHGYAEWKPDESSDIEVQGTITVDPDEKSATVNIVSVKPKSPAKKKPVTKPVVKKVAVKKAAKKVAHKK